MTMAGYTCNRCTTSMCFDNISMLMRHVVLCHANEPSFSYICTLESYGIQCCKVFNCASSYKQHIYRQHRDLVHMSKVESGGVNTQICCPHCDRILDSLSDLSSHYRVHCESGLKVRCVIDQCTVEFQVYSSYTSHMSRQHQNDRIINPLYNSKYLHLNDNVHNDVESVGDSSESMNSEQDVCRRHVAVLFLKLQEQCMLPNSTVQTIMSSFQDFLDLAVDNIAQKVDNVCSTYNISSEARARLSLAVKQNACVDAFNDLATNWKRMQYYKNNFNFVEPRTIRYNQSNPLVTDSFEYVPLLDSLQMLLKNEEILSQVLRPAVMKANIFSGFSDGSVFKQHAVYQRHPAALQLVLYADEFDVVNPLGVHASVHKMLAFYFVIGNLNQQLKSKKDAIQLLAICNSNDVKRHGLKAVADIIMDDVEILEQQGLAVSGCNENVYGSLAYITGDNLNSHMIGGFNASFGPNVVSPCRYCLVTSSEVQTAIESDLLSSRTSQNYDEQVKLIKLDPAMKTAFGLRYESAFNRGNFHVVDRLPADIMHDLLEGILPYEMALLLQQLIAGGLLTVQQLNRIINSWPYGTLDKQNKPVAISVSFGDKIKQNAARTWCLLRLLPLMIGPLVPQDNAYWRFLFL